MRLVSFLHHADLVNVKPSTSTVHVLVKPSASGALVKLEHTRAKIAQRMGQKLSGPTPDDFRVIRA